MQLANLLDRKVEGGNDRGDAVLANAPRDQLRVLRSEVQTENELVGLPIAILVEEAAPALPTEPAPMRREMKEGCSRGSRCYVYCITMSREAGLKPLPDAHPRRYGAAGEPPSDDLWTFRSERLSQSLPSVHRSPWPSTFPRG